MSIRQPPARPEGARATETESRISRLTRTRFTRAVRQFATSEVGGKARLLFAILMALLVGMNGLNVINSYVGRNFMTAIANRDLPEFRVQVAFYVLVFGICTVVAVFQRYMEERLGLMWRTWMTRNMVTIYLEHPTYYRMTDHFTENGEVANPDQRIAEDVKVFTTTTLSFVLMFVNGAVTAAAFSGVLWSIRPALLVLALAYAGAGSVLTVFVGGRLIALNSRQLDREADFRAELIHLRENAESVALLRHEVRLRERILRELAALAQNFRKMIGVNRNLGFFTNGYNYLIQILPALLVAPLYMRGEAEFGVITQSTMAFSALLGGISLIITQFQSISSFAAVIARLGALAEAAEQAQATTASGIQRRHSEDAIEYDHLTLTAKPGGTVLVRDLTLAIARGTRVLVVGPDDAKIALFRATAGIWDWGSGCLARPDALSLYFVPERPYVPPGTLRDFLVPAGRGAAVTDERIGSALQAVGAGTFLQRAGGLDVEGHWDELFSLGEQQLISFARIVLANPSFAILDRVCTTLEMVQVDELLALLGRHSISCVRFAKNGGTEGRLRYDAVLALGADGAWQYKRTEAGHEPTVTPSQSAATRTPSTSA